MSEAQAAFEREMRANGMFDDGSTAMRRDPETGGYTDPDTNAMWAGFCLAWGSCNELLTVLEAWFEAEYGYGLRPTFDAISDAIAKAKGE